MLNDLIKLHCLEIELRFFKHLKNELECSMKFHQESSDASVIYHSLENNLPMGSINLMPSSGHSVKGSSDYPIFRLQGGRVYTIVTINTGCSVIFTANDRVFDYSMDADLTPVFKSSYWMSGLIQDIDKRLDYALRSYHEKYGVPLS